MRVILLFVFYPRAAEVSEEQFAARQTYTLPEPHEAATLPLWTWFIENPRPRANGDSVA